MNCCENKVKEGTEMKGGELIKMERRIMLWLIVGVLFVAVLFFTFKAGAMGSSGAAVQSAGSVAKSAAASSYGGMVGGC